MRAFFQHREATGLPALDTLMQDLRYAFRTLRRDAGSTVLAILIAGIGIGAGSTVFSVVNALLLRPLPFRDPGRWYGSPQGKTIAPKPSTTRTCGNRISHSAIWRAGPASTARATRN
jgi:hypothetical protein